LLTVRGRSEAISILYDSSPALNTDKLWIILDNPSKATQATLRCNQRQCRTSGELLSALRELYDGDEKKERWETVRLKALTDIAMARKATSKQIAAFKAARTG
jgi:hypothetical protein